MAVNNYYINAATFANATTVFTDTALTSAADDGFYSDGVISREQKAALLGAAQTCINCANPTPTPTPTVTLTPTVTPVTPTPTVTVTQPLTATPTPTAGPTATPVPTPTPTVTPTQAPSGLYYPLVPCDITCDPDTRYIFATSAPVDQQRYVDPVTNCFYRKDTSSLSPVASVSPQSLITNATLLPGETGCPSTTIQFTYELERCSTGDNTYYAVTDVEYPGGAFVIDANNITYSVVGVISDVSGKANVGVIECLDRNGLRPSDTGFVGCSLAGCGTGQYFVLQECNPGQIAQSSGPGYIITTLTVSQLSLYGFPSWTGQTVYSTQTNKCYFVRGFIGITTLFNESRVQARIGGLSIVSPSDNPGDCLDCNTNFVN